MEHYGHKITCYVDAVGTDDKYETYIHLRFGNNSFWCKMTNAHKHNNVGKQTRLYQKSLRYDKFLVGTLLSIYGKYPMRTITVDSGFGITYVFDEVLHSEINFID